MKTKFPQLHDKKGQPVNEEDVIYDGKDYYRIYWNELHPQVEAFSPTYGYLHDLTQKDMESFERVGTFDECEGIMGGD